MPLPDWTVPFSLTSAVYAGASTLDFNTQTASGIYILRPEGCSLNNTVRMTKENVPQEDGANLHRRFVAGMEMTLAIQMWQTPDKIACYEDLEGMLDTLMGYLYGLLNAGDNEGRIAWLPYGNSSPTSAYRMLDDIRLMTYPVESQQPGAPYEIAVTLDTAWPYAEDLTQLGPASSPSMSLSGGAGTMVNNGNRPTYPVWQIHGPFDGFTLTNTTATPDQSFTYDGTLPGAVTVGGGSYLEIDTFKNTVYLNGSGANRKPGIVMTDSQFFLIPPGSSAITITYVSGGGGNNSSTGLINAAWA